MEHLVYWEEQTERKSAVNLNVNLNDERRTSSEVAARGTLRKDLALHARRFHTLSFSPSLALSLSHTYIIHTKCDISPFYLKIYQEREKWGKSIKIKINIYRIGRSTPDEFICTRGAVKNIKKYVIQKEGGGGKECPVEKKKGAPRVYKKQMIPRLEGAIIASSHLSKIIPMRCKPGDASAIRAAGRERESLSRKE